MDNILKRLEEMAAEWKSRRYGSPSDWLSDVQLARNEAKEDAFDEASQDLEALIKEFRG
jgi:hypothetical protein